MLHLKSSSETFKHKPQHMKILPLNKILLFYILETHSFRLITVLVQKSLKCFHGPCGHTFHFKDITHSKLIVWVHGSFPHRSGIVKALHIVGLIEAEEERNESNKDNRQNHAKGGTIYIRCTYLKPPVHF